MGKTIFLTGGVRSGKSRWAATHFSRYNSVAYLCVRETLEEEIRGRIEYNCKEHGIQWDIYTNADNLVELASKHHFIIFDDLTDYTKRAIERKFSSEPESISIDEIIALEREIIADTMALIESAQENASNLLIISTELGSSPVPPCNFQDVFRRILATVNQRIANKCKEVYLMVSGKAMKFSE